MEENESEAPRLSPQKKTKFRGSILKKKLINNNESSLDSTINEKPERKSRRVSFAAQTQIRVFEKEARHKSIGGSVASLRKKDYRKKTADIKAKATSLAPDELPIDRVNTPKHRFSIASNRDAETVSMDSFSHNVKNTVDKINKKKSPRDKDTDETTQIDVTAISFNKVSNSPVRRSPRLHRTHRTKGSQPNFALHHSKLNYAHTETINKPSAELCDFLLQPTTNKLVDSSVLPNDTTMHVDVSCILNRLDNSSVDLSVSNEQQNVAPQNLSHLIELSPPIKSAVNRESQLGENLIDNNHPTIANVSASPVKVAESVENWSMNLSNNPNSSLQTHNLISPENSCNEPESIRDPIDLLFDVSSTHISQQKNPIFYQVDSTESSLSMDVEPSPKNVDQINNNKNNDNVIVDNDQNDNDDSLLSHKLISILEDGADEVNNSIGDRAHRENADAVYETFLNKSNWFLDKISEINMDYTAKLIHSGSFNDSNNWNYRNNSGDLNLEPNCYNNTLFEDKHQITDTNVIDMDISADTSCTRGIEQLTTDAKNTFFALNSLLNPNRTSNNPMESIACLDDSSSNNRSISLLAEIDHTSPPPLIRSQSANNTSTTFVMPAILGDDLFEDIIYTIKIIRQNLVHSNIRLSENLNTNQTKMIQPLHDRNAQAENDNKELTKQINELFSSLSIQKKTMGQLQLDEKFLRSSLEKTKIEMDAYTCELDRKSLIDAIETDLFCSSLNIKYDKNISDTSNHCLNLFDILKLYFKYDIHRSKATIVLNDFLICPFLNPNHSLRIFYSLLSLGYVRCVNLEIKFLLALLHLHRNHLKTYFNGYCSFEIFSEKIRNISIKFYQICASFDVFCEYHCQKYPMLFNFVHQIENNVQLSFKVYRGNYLYSDITLRFALNTSLECYIESYEVVDLFQLFDCKNYLIEPLKQILDGKLLKPLFPDVNNLFISIEKIHNDFRQHVLSKYSNLVTDTSPKDDD